MNIGKASLTSFLTGFGPGVGDLRLKAVQMSLSGTVALPTHMLHARISATVDDSGEIVIADLSKALTFIKALPQDAMITLWQPKKGQLRLISGNTQLKLPTTDYVRSHKSVEKASTLMNEAKAAHWKSWAGRALTCYGKIDVKQLHQVKTIDKVIGKDKPVEAVFQSDEKLWTLNVGHKGSASMSIGIDMEDCDGPPERCVTHFGAWLSEALNTIPLGTVELYTADDYVAIFRHTEKDHLLLVMDKRGE